MKKYISQKKNSIYIYVKEEKTIRSNRIFKKCVAFAICLIVVVGIGTATSSAFRSHLYGLFFSQTSESTEIKQERKDSEVQRYDFTWIPDEYEKIDEDSDKYSRSVFFYNDTTQDNLTILLNDSKSFSASIDNESSVKETCRVGEHRATFFKSTENGVNYLIWQDGNVIISIASMLDKKQLIHIGEGMKNKPNI